MSEYAIQTALQTLILGLSAFESGDVVINDWTITDGETVNAPYVLIETADEFSSTQTSKVAGTDIQIKVHLFERFTTWKETLDALTTHRDALLTLFNDSDTGARAAGSVDGASTAVDIREIRSGSGIEAVYPHYLDPEEAANAFPLYLYQLMIFVAREY